MTSDSPGPNGILGSVRSQDGKGVVRIEHLYDSDVDDLWSAITDPARLADWYAEVDGDLRPRGALRIYVRSDDWEGAGRVEVCEPPRRLVVTWRESDESWRKGQGVPPFDATIEVALAVEDGHTELVAEVKGMPLDVVAFYGVGWQIHAENLAAYLAGRQRGDSESRWDDLLPAYQALAAVIS
jgi:uncharacterized protein YndB with AHSA1/START domain